MFKQYYILYEERTRMLQITVLENVHSIVGGGGGGGGGQSLQMSVRGFLPCCWHCHSNTLQSQGNYTHVFSQVDTQLLFLAFHPPWTSLQAIDHYMNLLTPLLSMQPQTKTVLTHERDTVMFQQVLFWSDAYPVKLCAVEWHVMCDVPVKSVDVIFCNRSCVRNVGMNGWA